VGDRIAAKSALESMKTLVIVLWGIFLVVDLLPYLPTGSD
jgi:hypothetical protein